MHRSGRKGIADQTTTIFDFVTDLCIYALSYGNRFPYSNVCLLTFYSTWTALNSKLMSSQSKSLTMPLPHLDTVERYSPKFQMRPQPLSRPVTSNDSGFDRSLTSSKTRWQASMTNDVLLNPFGVTSCYFVFHVL